MDQLALRTPQDALNFSCEHWRAAGFNQHRITTDRPDCVESLLVCEAAEDNEGLAPGVRTRLQLPGKFKPQQVWKYKALHDHIDALRVQDLQTFGCRTRRRHGESV